MGGCQILAENFCSMAQVGQSSGDPRLVPGDGSEVGTSIRLVFRSEDNEIEAGGTGAACRPQQAAFKMRNIEVIRFRSLTVDLPCHLCEHQAEGSHGCGIAAFFDSGQDLRSRLPL